MSVMNFLTLYKAEIDVLSVGPEYALLASSEEQWDKMKDQIIRVCDASRLGEALFGSVKNSVSHVEFSKNVDQIIEALVAVDVTLETYSAAKAGHRR
eukprot:6491431-Amphidinium_carterae.3